MKVYLDLVKHVLDNGTLKKNRTGTDTLMTFGYHYKINLANGEEVIIVQIAGLIARRIVCEVEQGQELKQGDRIGMIRFGSRVDLYFKNKKVLAKLGQIVVAGESLIASQ